MVLLKRTARINQAIQLYKLKVDGSLSNVDDEYISHHLMVKIHNALKSAETDSGAYPHHSLMELLKGSRVDTRKTQPKRRPQSKEFLEQMARLHEQAKEDEYQRLISGSSTSSISSTRKSGPTPSAMVKEVKEQVTSIINIMLSVGSVAWALWYWTGSSMGMGDAGRTLTALAGALIVLIAEVVIYGRYKFKVEEARTTERGKVEKTTILDSFSTATDVDNEKEGTNNKLTKRNQA